MLFEQENKFLNIFKIVSVICFRILLLLIVRQAWNQLQQSFGTNCKCSSTQYLELKMPFIFTNKLYYCTQLGVRLDFYAVLPCKPEQHICTKVANNALVKLERTYV
jgi:hypothetical protein